MRAALAIPLLLLGACAMARAGRRPLAVLCEDEPWSLGDVASRSPVFALYDDGLLIYLERPGDPLPGYASVKVGEAERDRLLGHLAPELHGIEDWYSLSDMPHHPFNVLHTWRDGRRRTIVVYGDLRRGSELRERCPPPFLEAYDALRHYRNEGATAWQPEVLRLHFSEQELPQSACRPWPTGWPGLTHSDTHRVGDGYVLCLDIGHLSDLVACREHPGNSHASVEISGRRGYLACMVPFPCDEAWADWAEDAASD